MPVWDPVVPVECDQCHEQEYFEMTALASQSFDLRDLDAKLRRAGWEHHGQIFLCENCASSKDNVNPIERMKGVAGG